MLKSFMSRQNQNLNNMNVKKTLTAVLICLIALAGCKKDEKSSPKNFIKYDGKTYAIDKGILEN